MPTSQRAGHRAREIEIRSALSGRLLQACVAGAGGFLAVLALIALAGRGSPWAGLAAASLLVWAAYFYRLIGLCVVAGDGVLEVRNLYRTRRVARSAIRSVHLGESSVAKAPSRTVVLELKSGGSLPLDACARTVQSRRGARRVEDFRRRLAGWCDEAA
ncbi:MAG TPA: PH domain-containing protein [Acidimicrobiales bacterium]|nr:PH domain-containing protein [Acidimicrobiales bacterium]